MTLGPILGSGGLAMLIPPSALAVLCGAIGEISITKILLAIIIPGLFLAGIMAGYIVIRCSIQKDIAPSENVIKVSIKERLGMTIKYVLPQGLVIFSVIGSMVLGIASPSEAAALGALSTLILTFLYKRLNWKILRLITISTVKSTGMILIVLGAAQSFSQMLAASGATHGLANFTAKLDIPPIAIIIGMQLLIIILGCLMDVVSIMMITLPIFIPIVRTLGYNDVWFSTMFLINIELAGISPPFGMSLFTMKAVAPKDTTIIDIYRAAIPFCFCSIIIIALILIFPQLALWLPNKIYGF